MLSGRGLCDEEITRPEESYRLCCIVVCDLEISRMGASYIYDISNLRVNRIHLQEFIASSKAEEHRRHGLNVQLAVVVYGCETWSVM